MGEPVSGAYDTDGKPYTPNPSLPLTDDELAAIDGAIEGIPARMRRQAIMFDRPRLMEKEPGQLAKLDKLIVDILKELKPKVPEDVAEKLFDRVMKTSVIEKYDDEQGSVGIFCYRLMDTMQCMVAIKEKFRGKKSTSMYDKKHATEQLKLRGLLRG